MTPPATGAVPLRARLLSALPLVLVVLIVPAALGSAIGGVPETLAAVVGAYTTFLVALAVGRRPALAAAAGSVVVSGLAAAVAQPAAWVVLLAVVGAGAGALSRVGLVPVGTTVGVVAASMQLVGAQDPVPTMLAVATGAGVALVLVLRLPVPDLRRGEAWGWPAASATALLLGLIAAAATALALGWGSPHAFWLPTAVFLIANPTAGLLLHQRTAQRVVGTGAGVLLGWALLPLGAPPWLRIAMGAGCLLAALVLTRPLWLNVGLTTLALVLVLDAAGTEPAIGLERIEAVLGAALLVAAAAGIARLARPWRRADT